MKPLDIEHIVLTFEQFRISQHLPDVYTMRAEYSHIYGGMIAEINRAVLGRHREITVSVPDNWIEAIKDRWLPKALRKRFPVRYRDIEAEVFAAYPELHINPMQRHKEGRVMVYHTKVREAYDQ